MERQEQRHPHIGATYKIAKQPGGGFGVEVSIPETAPVRVTGFGTRASAEAWVASHKRQVATGTLRKLRAAAGDNVATPD